MDNNNSCNNCWPLIWVLVAILAPATMAAIGQAFLGILLVGLIVGLIVLAFYWLVAKPLLALNRRLGGPEGFVFPGIPIIAFCFCLAYLILKGVTGG